MGASGPEGEALFLDPSEERQICNERLTRLNSARRASGRPRAPRHNLLADRLRRSGLGGFLLVSNCRSIGVSSFRYGWL